MKIYEIWKLIKNESSDVKNLVLASMDGQVDVRFQQIVDNEVQKLGVTYDGDLIADYYALKYLCDESIHSEGLDNHPELMLYRELIFLIDNVRVDTETDLGYEAEDIGIEAVLRQDGSRSQTVRDLFHKIMGKVYEAEYIDINNSTLSNLSNDRNMSLLRFPSVW